MTYDFLRMMPLISLAAIALTFAALLAVVICLPWIVFLLYKNQAGRGPAIRVDRQAELEQQSALALANRKAACERHDTFAQPVLASSTDFQSMPEGVQSSVDDDSRFQPKL